jgi:hypothetical protein
MFTDVSHLSEKFYSREIAHFMKWPNFSPFNELATTLAHFMNWEISINFLPTSWTSIDQFMMWAKIRPLHEMGNFTNGATYIEK